MRKAILFFASILIILANSSTALCQKPIKVFEDSIIRQFKKILKNPSDSLKEISGKKICDFMKSALNCDSSYYYSFDSLQFVGKLYSEDNLLRVYTWDIPLANGTYKYFGYVQIVDKKKKTKQVVFLNDKFAEMQGNVEKLRADNEHWFGALYYAIVTVKDGAKTYYTLCAWDGNNLQTNKKLIDVMLLLPDGRIQFGAPIFQMPKSVNHRIIFEHSKNSQMMLNYDTQQKMLVFDHLSPSNPTFANQFQYYGPDFSYDGFKYEKGKWLFQSNIILQNNEDEKQPKNRKVNKYENKGEKNSDLLNRRFKQKTKK